MYSFRSLLSCIQTLFLPPPFFTDHLQFFKNIILHKMKFSLFAIACVATVADALLTNPVGQDAASKIQIDIQKQ